MGRLARNVQSDASALLTCLWCSLLFFDNCDAIMTCHTPNRHEFKRKMTERSHRAAKGVKVCFGLADLLNDAAELFGDFRIVRV